MASRKCSSKAHAPRFHSTLCALLLVTDVTLAWSPPTRSSSATLRNLMHETRTKRRPSSSLTMSEKSSESSTQNVLGTVSDSLSGLLFTLLHLTDDSGIKDSSKNLRVLWVRAWLNASKELADPVAEELLPKLTRGMATSPLSTLLLRPFVNYAEFITSRTQFIDSSVDLFLSGPSASPGGVPTECTVVLLGAGYDTRALRYRDVHDNKALFVEVDLPEVVEGKGRLASRYLKERGSGAEKVSEIVGYDLNDDAKEDGGLIKRLIELGHVVPGRPTMIVSEAVLFYVDRPAIENLIQSVFEFSKSTDTVLCMTDSLKPFVSVPFTLETRKWLDKSGMELVKHASRWGGAVHYLTAVSSREKKADNEGGAAVSEDISLGSHILSSVDGHVSQPVNSYTPTAAFNKVLLDKPSFEETWYAVGYPWLIDGYPNAVAASLGGKPSNHGKPYATRLWNRPMVLYRDSEGFMVCKDDVCPHRSAPLSMGTMADGKLTCFYHGWSFGAKGDCVDVPAMTMAGESDDRFRKTVNTQCSTQNHAVVEHDGIVWVWRGNPLTADTAKLPRRSNDQFSMATVPIDSVLDYNVDYSYIVENNLDSPHLLYLHDGSVPPIEQIGMMAKNLGKLKLKAFQDDCGFGHLGRIHEEGQEERVKKIIRFDPPNIVRHGGVSGFEEEFHAIPIAPGRTRVLIRQHLPKGPILTTITSIPLMLPLITLLVNNWNYHIGLEDSSVIQGQSHLIEDRGAPRMKIGSLGDDLIKRYWSWRETAHSNLQETGTGPSNDGSAVSPYFYRFAKKPSGIKTGTAHGDRHAQTSTQTSFAIQDDQSGRESPSGSEIGSWGIKQNWVRDMPSGEFPPMNWRMYQRFLFWDDLVRQLLTGLEPSSTMVKTSMGQNGLGVRQSLPTPSVETGDNKLTPSFIKLITVFATVPVVDAILGGTLRAAIAGVLEEGMATEGVGAVIHDSATAIVTGLLG